MITVDTAVLGKRERDVRRGFSLPPKLGIGTLFDGAVHPGWTWAFVRSDPIVFANVAGRAAVAGRSTAPTAPCRSPATSTRSSIPTCRGTTSTGCGRCGTARSSSRGSSRSTMRCSPPSVASTPSPCPTTAGASWTRRRRRSTSSPRWSTPSVGAREIICDGGVRRGSDIVKAVALGANACMAGRAYLYGLGAAGERGVDHVHQPPRHRRPPHHGPPRRPHHRRPHPRPRPVLTTLVPAERAQLDTESDFPSGGRTPRSGVMNRPEVLALFARQHWVAGHRQLAELGVSASAIDRARRAARSCARRGVLAVAGRELSFEGRALACSSPPALAFVSGPPPACCTGCARCPGSALEVTIKQRRAGDRAKAAPARGDVVARRTAGRVTRADGLRVASPLRMLFGLAEQYNQHRFRRAAEDAWQLGLITPDSAGEYLAAIRRSGRTGVIRLEAWLEQMSFIERPAQTGLELDFVDMIAARRPPDTGTSAPAPPRQRRATSTSTSPGRRCDWPSSPVTPAGISMWPRTSATEHVRRRMAGRAVRPGARKDNVAPLEILAIYRRIADLGGSLSTSSR